MVVHKEIFFRRNPGGADHRTRGGVEDPRRRPRETAKGGEMDKAELKRLQTIALASRNYITLLDSYENCAELEEGIRSLEETAVWAAEHAEK